MRPGMRSMAVLALLGGCADLEPFDPPVAGEMNPGPGLFSGPDGVFVLSRGDVAPAPETAPDGQASIPLPRRKLTDPPPE